MVCAGNGVYHRASTGNYSSIGNPAAPMINLYASIDSYTTIDDQNGIFGIVINGAVEMAIQNARCPSGICRQSSLREKLKQNMTQDGQQDPTKANHLQRMDAISDWEDRCCSESHRNQGLYSVTDKLCP